MIQYLPLGRRVKRSIFVPGMAKNYKSEKTNGPGVDANRLGGKDRKNEK